MKCGKKYYDLYIECYEKSLEIVRKINDFLFPNEYEIFKFNEDMTTKDKMNIIKKSLESPKFHQQMHEALFILLESFYPINGEIEEGVYEILKENFYKSLVRLEKNLDNKYFPFLKKINIDRNKYSSTANEAAIWRIILKDRLKINKLGDQLSDIVWTLMKGSKPQIVDEFLKTAYSLNDIEFNRYTIGTNSDFSTIVKLDKGKLEEDLINVDFELFDTYFADIYGQDEALQTIRKVLLRNITFYNAEDLDYKKTKNKGPLATFMFYGPTGVGKTESAKVIADFVFGDEKQMLILDMNAYKDPRLAESFLRGHPEGYMDSNKGTDFTRFLKSNPTGVIVLDEFEKAHSSIREIFMSMLDEGVFRDALGNVYDLSGYIFIATTNASDIITNAQSKKIGFDTEKEQDKQKRREKEIRNGLRGIFTAPIMNRFNNLICFNEIKYDDAKKICKDLLYKLREKFSSKKIKGVTPWISLQNIDEVADILLKECDYEKDGVRSLKNVVNDLVGSQILSEILENGRELLLITVRAENGKLSVSSSKKKRI